MREDPDVILVGEIRDQETLNTALGFPDWTSGVRTTTPTPPSKRWNVCWECFLRKTQDSIRRSLSESLLGVIAQGLIRTTDGKRATFHDI